RRNTEEAVCRYGRNIVDDRVSYRERSQRGKNQTRTGHKSCDHEKAGRLRFYRASFREVTVDGFTATFNLFGAIPRSLLRKSNSQTSKRLSFPNASIGNPDETVTRPPTKTFGGDNFGINSHKCFLILRQVLRGDSLTSATCRHYIWLPVNLNDSSSQETSTPRLFLCRVGSRDFSGDETFRDVPRF